MSYEAFVKHVNRIIEKAGGGIKVRFSNEPEGGRYIAKFSDGTTITGNGSCLSLSVRWGSGHVAMAAV